MARAVSDVKRWGLGILPEPQSDDTWYLTYAGQQFLAYEGRVPTDALKFLSTHVDNLHSREALRLGGHLLVDALLLPSEEGLIERVRSIVPPAFSTVVDGRLAHKFMVSVGSLMARLGEEEPAGCVAEEILAVELIENAEQFIELWSGVLTEAESESARRELRGVFELFQDDDVLRMFDMKEPADASVESATVMSNQLGIADQRPEAWFRPFGSAISTGSLDEDRVYDWPIGGWGENAGM